MEKNIQVFLKKITLRNFRKFPYMVLEFDQAGNVIVGTNKSGKSTIANAHSWLWSQYDLENRDTYQIKPAGAEKGNITFVEEVIGVIDHAQGTSYETSFGRELVEVLDDDTGVFKANQQKFYIDGVEKKTKRDFMDALNAIIDIDIFRVITSPTYLLTMKQEDMRKMILDLVGGDVSDADLVKDKPEYEKLIEILSRKKVEDYYKEVKQSLKAAEDQKKGVPKSVDEVNLAIAKLPTMQQFAEMEMTLKAKKKELEALELQLKGVGEDPAVAAREKLKVELGQLESSLKVEEGKFRNALTIANNEQEALRIPIRKTIVNLESAISIAKQVITTNRNKLAELKTKFEGFTEEWHKIDKEVFVAPAVGAACPNCGKPFTQEEVDAKLETAEGDFNTDKADRKAKIRAKSSELLPDKKALEEGIANAEESIPTLEQELLNEQEKLATIHDKTGKFEDQDVYKKTQTRITEIKDELEKPLVSTADDESDNVKLLNDKEILSEAISALTLEYGKKDVLESNQKRLVELADLEKEINVKVLAWKKAKDVVESYLHDKSSILEEKVNRMFEMIQFRLFKQNNDGELKLDCVPMVDGVDYGAVNRADQIKAHVDVAKTFMKRYGVRLPIFVDNKESVVTSMPEVDTQVIYLKVDELYPTITLKSA